MQAVHSQEVVPTSAPDVVVIGGGPAGCTAATLIAQRGYAVRLYEREHFPRFHIGESLVPETYWVLKRLNMLSRMKASPFVKKQSVQFIHADGKGSAPFYFADNRAHESSQTWQVVRSEFDAMLLDNAREHGVDAQEGVRVLDVIEDGPRVIGVRIRTSDGSTHQVRCRVVVDASGQSGLLMNKYRLRVWDPELNKGAIWTYWHGAKRETGRDEGATLILQTRNRQGWFWYIPLHDDRVSIGIVAPFEYLFQGRRDHEQTFLEELDRCPGARERLATGKRITGYFATRDYSYRCTQVAGDGWVLVGDAFGFLDPLYSSGVLLALRSGELAADAIVEGLESNDLTAAQLGRWGPAFNQAIDRMRRLVCEYYAGFSFGDFVRQFPELKGKITDLLIGDLFNDTVDQVWKPMQSTYPPGRQPPKSWDSGVDPALMATKQNELIVPEGHKP